MNMKAILMRMGAKLGSSDHEGTVKPPFRDHFLRLPENSAKAKTNQRIQSESKDTHGLEGLLLVSAEGLVRM